MCKVLLLFVLFTVTLNFINCACPNIISRREWNANSPKKTPKSLKENPAPYIVIHHSETPNCFTSDACKTRVRSIQNYHQNHNGWEDIGYNFLVGGDGNVYEGRGWGIWGAHVPRFNSNSIGICVLGQYARQAPSERQLNTLRELIACAKENNYVTNNYHLIGHRQGKQTTCPGDGLFNEIKTWPHFDLTVAPN